MGDRERDAAKAYVKRHPVFSARMPFFIDVHGQRLSKNAIYKEWRIVRKAAGFPNAHIHDFRHSSLTQLAQQPGVTLADVMAFAGHKDIRSAMRYQHSDSERLEAFAKARSETLG